MNHSFRLWIWDLKTLDLKTWNSMTWNLKRGTLNFLVVLVMLGLHSACQSGAPEQLSLSDEKIAQIMADLSIADAATTGLAGFPKDSLMHVYFNQVLEMHGITLENYEKDLRILAKDLPRMERIVKQADEFLTEKNAEEGADDSKFK